MGKYRPLRARGVKNIRRAGDGADARARRRRSRSSVVGRLRPGGTGATRFPRGGGPRDSTSGSTSENVRAPLVCGRRRDDDPHAIDALVSRTRTRRSL